ncbi:AbrB/MazE/SpoVT family DNA-binding domain-containing protein [Paenibacillus sp. IB182496]|uniref:AbrB/MazE/SpoVT family DNA-binding domain-containing protein n=1 Tax=Paenibacillus sabuli TaxID=2772509 RepID=A0A927BV66_9BACL|nr:AbrB/MazE/SpoVT family DNA-binding domain-containing protein [Paenibacillus sabuli]MBD2846335.1 AbrB/MazE/SpoVT family DNA-binding domain-containing protein [Paenibacillus sabuli]
MMMKKLTGVNEYRDIKITSKRQLTIPKSYFDALNIEEEVHAYLLDDGIFLQPARSQETREEKDIQAIVKQVLSKGLSEEQLAEELTHRINEYRRLLKDRVQTFMEDMADSGSEEDEGDLDFNGLDVFFDKKNATPPQGS